MESAAKRVQELTLQLEGCVEEQRTQIQLELDTQTKFVDDHKECIASREAEARTIAEAFEKEMQEEIAAFEANKERDNTELELDRMSVGALEELKARHLEADELEFTAAQEKYNEAKMLLNECKKNLSGVEERESALSAKTEDSMLRLSKVLEGDLTFNGKQDELLKLREHKLTLKEIEVEGKIGLANRQENYAVELDRLSEEKKRFRYVLEDFEKTQERAEAEYKELQSRFERDREDERTTMEAMVERLRDIEEETDLSRNLAQTVGGGDVTASDSIEMLLVREKRR